MQQQKINKVLFFLMVWPESKASAAGWRMLSLFEFFESIGYEIFALSAAQNTPLSDDLQSLGIHCQSISENDANLEVLLREVAPQIVVFDRFITEEKFSWRVKQQLPKAFRILDTEDLHFLRHARKVAHQKQQSIDFHHDITYRELASIYRSDLSLIISEVEKELLVDTLGLPKDLLYHLPLVVPKEKKNVPSLSFEQRKDLLFVGNFMHEPNRDAVSYLKSTLWPKLRKKRKDLQLFVYGAYAKQRDYQLNKPEEGFHVVGWSEDILKEMASKKIVLLPLRIGAGQKGKFIDALLSQTPVVATSLAIESMCHKDNLPGLIGDNSDDFVEAILALIDQPDLWYKKQALCKDLLNEKFNTKKEFKAFEHHLKHLVSDLESHRNRQLISAVFWHHSLRSTEFMSRWIELKNKKAD